MGSSITPPSLPTPDTYAAKSKNHTRDDQDRAYALRAAVRVSGRGARGERPAGVGPDFVDRGGDDRSAFGGDGVQPASRPRVRRGESEDEDAGDPRRTAERAIRRRLHRRVIHALLHRGVHAQSADADPFAGGAGLGSALFVYEAVHVVVPSGSGMVSVYCAHRGVDRGAWGY